MRQVTQSASESEPAVTMIEDLHWLDEASAEFVEQMVDARAGTRSLLLLNFRPEYHAEWMQKSWYRQIPLTPLGPDAIAELLADLLGDDPSLASLAGPIHARTGGNPFFTEEVAQSLIESGNLEALAQGVAARALLRRLGAAAQRDAEAALAEAAALIERTGARALAPALLEWRAELAAVLGDEEARVQLLRDAQRGHEEMGACLTE